MNEQKLIKKKNKAIIEGNTDVLLSASADLAEIYMNTSRYKNAVDEYKEIANIHREKKNEMDYARANRAIGEAYMGLRDFEAALEHQRIYLDIAKKENNKLELQRAYATLGHIFLSRYLDEVDSPQKVYLDSAYKYFTKSLQTCEKLTGISKFERADMSARIFSNLGIVHDCLGEYNKGIELLNKSIVICKSNDIYEQLHRAYISLASLYEKTKKYNNAIQNYNLAFEVAKKLKNKAALMCSTLLSKSDVLIKLADFSAAKICLYKAYKLNTPVLEDKTQIERNLRVVVAICQTQQKLLSTPDYDYKELKALYEKMGDGACDLKNYDKAIEYYHKMLEAVENCEEDERAFATCYFSLAETYRDNKQYTDAIEYYNKELNLCKDLKDKINTLIKIADCTEANAYPTAEVRAVYDMGIRMCREEGNTREECRFLSRYINYLRRSGINVEAFKLEQRLAELGGYITSDAESDDTEMQGTPTIGDDISLSNITDVSDTSDTEDISISKRPAKRRCRNYTVKRNMKGETALHTACIGGNITVVKHLLEQGHPVNVRDHCGWLPLHEACINGHLEIVELLLERGAQINDRGGQLCNGVTPLHDAASNGHLDIVELLINRGATVVAKTDDGQTVVDYLKSWHSSADLQSDEEMQYRSLLQKLTHAIEKSGQKSQHFQPSTSSLQSIPSQYVQSSPNKYTRRSDEIQCRRFSSSKRSRSNSFRCSSSESDNDEISESEIERVGAADDYRNIMNELRNKSANESQKKRDSSSNKIPALLSSEEVIDDWLIDDLGPNTYNKRRKTSDPFTRTSSFSRNNSFEKHSPNSKRSASSNSESINRAPSFVERSPAKQMESSNLVDLTSESSNANCRKSQNSRISLLDAGFERIRARSPLRSVNTNNPPSNKPKKVHQVKLTHFGSLQDEPDSTTRSPMKRHSAGSDDIEITSVHSVATIESKITTDPTLSVDVRIEGRLYRVPVLMSQIHTRTIKWLAEEAALRYSKKELMKPVLELESKSGAVLADEDLLSILFTAGSVQAEEVEARVVEWNIPPISERYKEACSQSGIELSSLLLEKLQGLSIRLDLSNSALRGAVLNPLCKALNRQTSLLELHLSGNFLSVDNLRLLALSLPSLKSLALLNLSYTGLTLEHIQIFANTLASTENVAPNLHNMDLSYNFLGENSIRHIATMSRKLNLHSLCLADCDFGRESFSKVNDINLEFQDIVNLDLSNNNLAISDIEKVLSYLNPEKLTSLDISRNNTDPRTLKEVVKFLEKASNPKLSVLNMSRSNCQDSDIFNMLGTVPHLEVLNVSYNMELTGISLRRLLSHPSLTSLNLSGCSNVLKYFEDCTVLNLNAIKNMKTLKISIDQEENPVEFQSLTKFWRDLHGDKAVVESMPHFLSLSV